MVPKMPIKAILWDCDGTLVDSEPLHQECIGAVAGAHGAPLEHADIKRFLGRTTGEIWDYLKTERGLTLDKNGWRDAVHSYYASHVVSKVKTRPGVDSQILLFAAMGLRQAVVSNSTRPLVDASLKVIGPANMLEFSISVDDVGKPKPDPEPYYRAALKMMLPPHQCLVLEDSPAGARAAKAAGMRTMVWPQDPALIYDEVDYITDSLSTPDWVRIIRKRRKPKPLIARSLAAGIPADLGEDSDDHDGEFEAHPSAVPKTD
jgi:beta-phosphoglucomutase-like phosphatase (HAD superfamily)